MCWVSVFIGAGTFSIQNIYTTIYYSYYHRRLRRCYLLLWIWILWAHEGWHQDVETVERHISYWYQRTKRKKSMTNVGIFTLNVTHSWKEFGETVCGDIQTLKSLFVPSGWSGYLYYYSAICCQSLPERKTKHHTICERLRYAYYHISKWENRKEMIAPLFFCFCFFKERHRLILFLSIPFFLNSRKNKTKNIEALSGNLFGSALWWVEKKTLRQPLLELNWEQHCT